MLQQHLLLGTGLCILFNDKISRQYVSTVTIRMHDDTFVPLCHQSFELHFHG